MLGRESKGAAPACAGSDPLSVERFGRRLDRKYTKDAFPEQETRGPKWHARMLEEQRLAAEDQRRFDDLHGQLFDTAVLCSTGIVAVIAAIAAEDYAMAHKQFEILIADVRKAARMLDRLEKLEAARFERKASAP